jgi:hypothetical protein
VRRVAIALAALTLAGCGDDTVLRILVEPGSAAAPSSLVVTLVGVDAPPRTVTPVTLPGTLVVHHVPSSVTTLCVEVDALDDGGSAIGGGAATVQLVRHGTASATVTLDDPGSGCAAPPDDLGAPEDLATPPDGDLATTPDLGTIQICPTGSIFCDDFESGNTSKWSSIDIKQDLGAVAVQSMTKAHGTFALRALGNGAPGNDVYAEVTKAFTPTAPPFALRANVFFPQALRNYDHLIALYENNNSTNSFSIGGDNNGLWVVAENESTAGDFPSDMVPTTAGQWHCVELVIDAAGMVTLYVDNHRLVGPWQRTSAVTYSQLMVGVTRSVDTNYVAYIDDVAIGPSRLYCPP